MNRRIDAVVRLTARGLLLIALFGHAACTAPAQKAPAAKPEPAAAKTGTTPAAPTASTPAAAPVRTAPTRPAAVLWATTRLRNADYVNLRDVAKAFGLKAAWNKTETVLSLSDAGGVRLVFESNQKDFYFDGLRVFLGATALPHQDSVWATKLDVIKIIVPLLRPGDHVAFLPATPPRLIVIDAGHGGIDPGTQNLKLGLNEKTYTLDVALRVQKLLLLQNWRVVMVREKDVELSKDKKADLLMRDELANRHKADVYLSIHFNSAGPAVTGVETYVLAPQFMLSAGDEQGDDMTNTAYPGNRLDYANLLLGEKIHRAMITGLKTPDRGYKHARKAVLRMLDCPGVLVECGYISNDAEARRIATPEFRQQIAEAIAAGVRDYAATLAALRPVPDSVK